MLILDNSPLIYDVDPGDHVAWVLKDEIQEKYIVCVENDQWILKNKSGKCPHIVYRNKQEFLEYLNLVHLHHLTAKSGVYRKIKIRIS